GFGVCVCFFFQAEDGIRDRTVTGVQTCALPIFELELGTSDVAAWYGERRAGEPINYGVSIGHIKVRMAVMHDSGTWMPVSDGARSEERRVGKECRSRWAAYHEKKK